MAQFPLEVPDNPETSGNGNFLNLNHEKYNHFYDSTTPRCNGFLVDRPPHDTLYFQKQLEAVGKYYEKISNGALNYTADIIINSHSKQDGYYTLSDSMEYYAKADTSLARLFYNVLDTAKADINLYFVDKAFTPDDVVFIVFHAGLSQDFSYQSLDPTIYDLKSAYIDEIMMKDIGPSKVLQDEISYDIKTGILLPETQNIIYYDVVEDIFGNPDYGTTDLCDIQIGLTGIFAFLLGYELGLPPMFNNDSLSINYGDPGVGYFGLMDHGSNNGRGVFPSPPTPWTRSIITGWSDVKEIDFQNSPDTVLIEAYHKSNKMYKIDISQNEYFLIENRSNYIIPGFDIEYLRYLLWDNYLCENCDLNCNGLNITEIVDSSLVIEECVKKNPFPNERLHYFDVIDTLIKHDPSLILNEEFENNIFSGFANYDLGLPGSGILIWHITEPLESEYITGVNNDRNNRAIHLEEGDGAVDIGFESYAFFASDAEMLAKGWPYDYWFNDNNYYLQFGNPYADEVVFDNWSNPNTRTTDGAESFLSIKILTADTIYTVSGDTIYTAISDSMYIKVQFNEEIDIHNLELEPVQYLGNAYNDEYSTATVFYEKDGVVYSHTSDSTITPLDMNYTEGNLIYTYKEQFEYLPADTCIHPFCLNNQDEILPLGYIDSSNVSIPVLGALSLGDLDGDGLDEIITIEKGDIIARNSNQTLVNGFPLKGDFTGIPLIANILSLQDSIPEIICREGDDIVILSNRGERIRQLSSFASKQPLALVPFWNGKMALIDGSRLFLFDLDMDHSYWLNPHSRPSGFPLSTGVHFNPEDREYIRRKAYNYPNPITEGTTTFRVYVGNSTTSEVRVKIYNAAGYLVVDDLIINHITHYEFNEIPWNNIQLDAGLYLAEIKPDVGSSELVRLVVIK